MTKSKVSRSKITIEEKIFCKNYTIISRETEKLIDQIYNTGQNEQNILLELIIKRILIEKNTTEVIDGFIFQKLIKTNKKEIEKKLLHYFPNGVLILQQSLNLNYQTLQKLLINEEFEEANKLTQQYLCKLVEIETLDKREWLYFTDIQFLPSNDLLTLDSLWKIYSKGKFGFSIQKKIWISNNKNWDKLWEKINWIDKGIMKRYPQGFTWTLEAPEGHLPLFNQLRGTQSLSYLFKNIKW
uniref:Uncharacterized protein n=1 Tax=Ophidocladus simpliciusculus TaxID=1261574 RepID=A0A1Z1MIK7_9FLOR|nr:hypothetical protein [Ophidocladus simpliciusculus]ARW65910.1 hypothetical protein [Ophidocladus simpliciusculus]